MKLKTESVAERLAGACFSLLVAAVALYVAVKLIEAVWEVLLIVLAAVAVTAGIVAIGRFRRRSDGW